jgi:hypothetical protein
LRFVFPSAPDEELWFDVQVRCAEPMTGSIVVPAITAEPSGLSLLASKLGEAIEIIRSWRIRVPEPSRLPVASRLLEQIATRSSYPSDPAQLNRIANSIRIAFDFYHITRVLPEERIAVVAEDLRRALKGTVDDVGPTEANRAQSQVLMAAVMAAGGLKPGAPRTGGGVTPDYVTQVGTLSFAVEIKRPESLAGLKAKIDEAIGQLAAIDTAGGVLVIDVSDCMSLDSLSPSAEAAATPDFQAIRNSVRQAVISSTRPGRNKISNLFVFANLFGWRPGPPPCPHPIFLTYQEVLHSARAGLIVDASRDVRRRIGRGFHEFGAETLEQHRVE